MKIEISDKTFERLQKQAKPLIHTVEDVLVILLDFYEGEKGEFVNKGNDTEINTNGGVNEHVKSGSVEVSNTSPIELRGFQKDLWELIIEPMPSDIFSLQDIYKKQKPLEEKHPHIREFEAAIRATLQKLKVKGCVEFIERGRYRRLNIVTASAFVHFFKTCSSKEELLKVQTIIKSGDNEALFELVKNRNSCNKK